MAGMFVWPICLHLCGLTPLNAALGLLYAYTPLLCADSAT